MTKKADDMKNRLLRKLPGVDILTERFKTDDFCKQVPKSVLTESVRKVIDGLRKTILEEGGSGFDEDDPDFDSIVAQVYRQIEKEMAFNLRNTINATGVIIHTNLGRSLLAEETAEQVKKIATGYSNLEFNLDTGKRGIRYACIEDLLCELTGAEAALAVNNNAGAVLLCLETLAGGKEVIVSRGELVEIGGSFRIPDVMLKSGAVLKEVGTTNRTHVKDYENAIHSETGLLLKVHKSNYSIVGFTAEIGLKELVAVGRHYGLPVMEDLGSGTLVDFSRYGVVKEPTVQASVKAGADVITFSGDKLLGGPQAGLIIGREEYIRRIKKNPLTRALRIDKMTLAALESTLRIYRDEENAVKTIPTLKMITLSKPDIQKKADHLFQMIRAMGIEKVKIEMAERSSKAGGGSLPLVEMPSICIAVTMEGLSVNDMEIQMRQQDIPVIGRIEGDRFMLDLRTVQENEYINICDALKKIANSV